MTKKVLLITIVCAAFGSVAVQAADAPAGRVMTTPRPVETSSEWRPHFGLVAGAVQAENSNQSSGEYGFDVGYQAYVPYSLGVEYSHSRLEVGSTDHQDRDTVWLKGTYNFAGDNSFIRHTYAALAVGAVFTSQTSAAIAPILGFDIPLRSDNTTKQFLSVGANTRYAFIGNNEDDTFSVSGVVKYWY
jgi:hypothetical protein